MFSCLLPTPSPPLHRHSLSTAADPLWGEARATHLFFPSPSPLGPSLLEYAMPPGCGVPPGFGVPPGCGVPPVCGAPLGLGGRLAAWRRMAAGCRLAAGCRIKPTAQNWPSCRNVRGSQIRFTTLEGHADASTGMKT